MKKLTALAFETLQNTLAEVQTDIETMHTIANNWIGTSGSSVEMKPADREAYKAARRQYEQGISKVNRITKAIDEEA